MNIKDILIKIANHLKYPSSQKSLAGLVSLAGISITDGQAQVIIGVIGAIIYLVIEFFFSDVDVKDKDK